MSRDLAPCDFETRNPDRTVARGSKGETSPLPLNEPVAGQERPTSFDSGLR